MFYWNEHCRISRTIAHISFHLSIYHSSIYLLIRHYIQSVPV